MKRLFIVAIFSVFAFGVFTPVHAEDIADRFGLGIGIGYIKTKDFRDTDIDSGILPGINLTYGIISNLSLELSAGRAKLDMDEKDYNISVGKLTIYPVQLTAQYRIPTGGSFSPYIGAGIGYYFTEFDTSSASVDALRDEVGDPDATFDVKLDNSFGYHINLGMDYFLSKNVAFNIDARYAWVKIGGKVRETVFGIPSEEGIDKERLDPYTISVGIKYFF